MGPPAPWGGMDSPVMPANDAEVGGLSAPSRHSSESRSPGSAADWNSGFRWNDGEGTTALRLPSWGEEGPWPEAA